MGAALAPYNAGMTFGPYHVTAKIGEGGMGEVYRTPRVGLIFG